MAGAPQNPQTNPIINSPYQEPKWHWTLDDRQVAQPPLLPGPTAGNGDKPRSPAQEPNNPASL